MASPQLEHGYTRIANEILEALARTPLAGRQRRVLDLIFRESYGRGLMYAELSYGEMAKRLNMARSNTFNLISSLRRAVIISVEPVTGIKNNTSHKTRFIFRKDYHRWSVIKNDTGIAKDNSSVIAKDNTPIYIYKKEKERTLTPLSVSDPLPGNAEKIPEWLQKTGPVSSSHVFIKPPRAAPGHSQVEIIGLHRDRFNQLWEKYPKKHGREAAYKAFLKTVKTDEDWENIQKALDNYCDSKEVESGFAMKGARWFGLWEEWVEVDESEHKKNGGVLPWEK